MTPCSRRSATPGSTSAFDRLLERAGRKRRRANRRPRRTSRPSSLGDRLQPHRRRHLGDDDVHPIRAPDERAGQRGRGRIRDDLHRAPGAIRAQRPRRDPRARDPRPTRQRAIFRLTGGSIFQGEQSMDQMAFMRPSLLAGYATPVDRALPLWRRDHPGGGVSGEAAPTRGRKAARSS